MAAPNFAISRLLREANRLAKDPTPYIWAAPLPSNFLEWHFVVEGPADSPYAGGFYHGQLVFPVDYPFKPPKIIMITPNGRFRTNSRLCLSISDFHPDTWNPAWSVSTILAGLLSFMLETAPTLGSMDTSDAEKHLLAKKSIEFNLKSKVFCFLFPQLVERFQHILESRHLAAANNHPVNAAGSNGIAVGPAAFLNSVGSNCLVVLGFFLFLLVAQSILSLSA